MFSLKDNGCQPAIKNNSEHQSPYLKWLIDRHSRKHVVQMETSGLRYKVEETRKAYGSDAEAQLETHNSRCIHVDNTASEMK